MASSTGHPPPPLSKVGEIKPGPALFSLGRRRNSSLTGNACRTTRSIALSFSKSGCRFSATRQALCCSNCRPISRPMWDDSPRFWRFFPRAADTVSSSVTRVGMRRKFSGCYRTATLRSAFRIIMTRPRRGSRRPISFIYVVTARRVVTKGDIHPQRFALGVNQSASGKAEVATAMSISIMTKKAQRQWTRSRCAVCLRIKLSFFGRPTDQDRIDSPPRTRRARSRSHSW